MTRLSNRDWFASRLVELAEETQSEIVDELTTPDGPECKLCGAKKFKRDTIDVETKAETYITDCPVPRCDGELSFIRFYLKIDEGVPVINEDFAGVHCSGEACDISERRLPDVVVQETPTGIREYTLPIKGIISTAIHEHHTDYPNDETISVCATCHRRIHRDDDFRPDLRPDISWEEWQGMND